MSKHQPSAIPTNSGLRADPQPHSCQMTCSTESQGLLPSFDDSIFEEPRIRIVPYDTTYAHTPTTESRYLLDSADINALVKTHFTQKKNGPTELIYIVQRYYALGKYEFVERLCCEVLRLAETHKSEDRRTQFGIDEYVETAARCWYLLAYGDWESRPWWNPFLASTEPGHAFLRGKIQRCRKHYNESLQEFKKHLDERPTEYKARIECARTMFESRLLSTDPLMYAQWALVIFLRANEVRVHRPALSASTSFTQRYSRAELVAIKVLESQIRYLMDMPDSIALSSLNARVLQDLYSEDIVKWIDTVLVNRSTEDGNDEQEPDRTVREL
ncbi:hypothetical protein SeLEV6574_g05739 [Synchytrium endobioticum]|uniref:Uncharacterized protein n=1 Tax=Synchytrium endobioticum TaxID=286115 RepID=A0A507CSJ7_9FUNG|nr:hypothetical protein SeLEV6574_g05739 [Synchytrium endobioticum]